MNKNRDNQKDFVITGGKGFQIRFPNGYIVSIQFGTGSYSDHRAVGFGAGFFKVGDLTFMKDDLKAGAKGSNTAETAIIKPDGNFLVYPPRPGDDVQGLMTSTEVQELLRYVMAL